MAMPDKNEMGAIFDLDGVLVDTAWAHLQAWRALAAREGFEMSPEYFYSTFGMQNCQILPELVGQDVPRNEIDRMGDWKEQRYREIIAQKLGPADGVLALLEDLKATGFRLAVGSSAPRPNVELMLGSAEITDYFDAFVCGQDVTHGKPHPETFLTAAAKLAISPDRCVVVEDAVQGVAAGKAGGMVVIAVTSTRKREELAQADLVVDTLAEIGAKDFTRLIEAR